MNPTSQVASPSPRWRVSLYLLLGITVLNYVAQIPYYLHFYGVYHVAPTPFAVVFLLVTFALFLAGYVLTLRVKLVGGWLLLLFLLLEFGGYLLHNLSGAFLQDLPTSDLLFFTVSLIGYLNFAASFVALLVLAINRQVFWRPQHASPSPRSSPEVQEGTSPSRPGT